MNIKDISGKTIKLLLQYYSYDSKEGYVFQTLEKFLLFCEDIDISESECNQFKEVFNKIRDKLINKGYENMLDGDNRFYLYVIVYHGKIYHSITYTGLKYKANELLKSESLMLDGLVHSIRCNYWSYDVNHENKRVKIKYDMDLKDDSKNIHTISIYDDCVKLCNNNKNDINDVACDIFKGYSVALIYNSGLSKGKS